MAVNEFRPKKYEDFEIINDAQRVIGHIRVKPSGVLWAPSGSKVWYGISLDEFSSYMEKKGKKQKK